MATHLPSALSVGVQQTATEKCAGLSPSMKQPFDVKLAIKGNGTATLDISLSRTSKLSINRGIGTAKLTVAIENITKLITLPGLPR